MTTITHRTPPAPIRTHLHHKYTTAHHADARIEQVYERDLGWVEVPAQPFPSPGAIAQLRDRGALFIALGYNVPPFARRPGVPVRARADFTVGECLP